MCDSFSREQLYEIISELFQIKEPTQQIKVQIRKFLECGFSFKGIARTLCYLHDVRQMDFSRPEQMKYGIGIVKTAYQEANLYYERVKQQMLVSEQRQQDIIAAQQIQPTEIICGEGDANRKRPKRLIDISSL